MTIQTENQTLASITFQNYFRLYKKLAGMTGTARDRGRRVRRDLQADVVEIPTHRPMVRKDEDDEVYRTAREKNDAIVERDRGRARQAASRSWSAPSRSRSPSSCPTCSRRKERAAPGAERPLPRAGGAHRRPGRPAGRGDHRHQHGRPRHRHPARRQRRHARSRRSCAPEERERRRGPSAIRAEVEAERAARARTPAACSSSAPSGTRAAASTTSCAAARAARAIPAAPSSSSVLDDDLMRHLRLRAHGRDAAAPRPQGRRGDHPPVDQQGAGEGAAEGRGLQLRDPQAPAEVRRRDERPAQGRLRAAPRADGGRGRRRHGRATCATRSSRTWSRKHMPAKAYAEQWDIERPARRRARACSTWTCRWRNGPRRKASPTQEIRERLLKASDELIDGQEPQIRRADACGWPRRACCCRSSTICGRSTCCTSTICARASTCAATPSAIR